MWAGILSAIAVLFLIAELWFLEWSTMRSMQKCRKCGRKTVESAPPQRVDRLNVLDHFHVCPACGASRKFTTYCSPPGA